MTLIHRLLLTLCLFTLPLTAAAALHDQVAEQLRDRLEVATAEAGNGDADPERSPLHRFFLDRVYRPAWSEDGQPTARAEQLLAVLAESRGHGLAPAAYGYDQLSETLRDWPEEPAPGAVADLELQLTRVWLQLAEDALTGQLNPDVVAPDWELQSPPSEDLVQALSQGLAEDDIATAVRQLYPDQDNYHQMRRALARFQALAEQGDYPRMEAGPLLRVGDRDPRVETLREQLRLLGDLEDDAPLSETLYGEALEAAVRDFQRRHGLQVDGVVGPRTVAALNTPPADRAEQLRVNLERLRWMPRDLGDRYILVNIAGFSMTVHAEGETVMRQRVVVGRDYRRTPVFTGNMTYLVLNPSWEVPHRLATRDVLPLIQRDPEYLERMGFRVLQGWGADEREIDPESLDWDRYSHRYFPYRLRQLPGPQNAMGRVKFMFPNRHNVYLHDTPSRELFQQPRRAFSSGCIRVERPLELAAWLLRDQRQWSPEAIDKALEERRERTVPLRRGIPVHLQYWTAWVDAEGTLHFRDDLYDRDTGVAAALAALPKPEPTLWPELGAATRR
ncbi:L,D-transpeptidase family protein [Alkalilimnicola ehrlichii MLHE-1]|uniref:Peptidoglycan-binding domain 1 protein n=1 Tax=Alkalilimnicola ehrlichii (strain ATCC BAA-1101 / DSM 17681 / MLHE-1) TaxID=187272 RepID=Q0ACI4_ALKEH|nr:L,D-transpeptidase family protein [Alkalilimnicola ehrlichii]ABI55453.1 Peptidoglycan-binding domain 1 protein [Alkalilimnicola ehrlichii MLHE-1]